MGQQASQVMQGLTIMATLFIPLTFEAGSYGMSCKYMPRPGVKVQRSGLLYRHSDHDRWLGYVFPAEEGALSGFRRADAWVECR
jgi:hypothetical protein